MSRVIVSKVIGAEERQEALGIVEQVFLREKQWIGAVQEQIPDDLADNRRCSWFMARVNGEPAGLLRLYYDPPLELPEEYDVTFMPGIDPEQMKTEGRYVEIGRFMIRKEFRSSPRVALRLMRSAVHEVLERDYTHFITDVFEGEVNSPLKFHTRVLGFRVVGSHLFGELQCSSTRIILTLDILDLYRRVRNSRSRIYRELTDGMGAILERKLSVPTS
ncbi:GNAT family N-acetyltransferase [Prosthecochloris sp. ZM_2]|uniref:GNAT family N-acetyltransferase n=1 Tax=Prosthecochloris sp. ZM_2 TaxID=2045206 RepID=UPI000DF81E65|nr:GNAT family N-acetyltransferase [Prosthecochloris sp. ZM_2]RNA65010.1 GNAT family N-acetyltransferase [Prosthecochloris sp. ZM_2]